MRRPLAMVVSLVGFTTCFTWMYQSMASVMEVGGACASGGPYLVAQPCPDGAPALLLGGLFGGAVFVGISAIWARGLGPPLVALWWPVLFCGLGVNFLRFGIDPPGGGGLEWGWLVCGVVFQLMGLVPLVLVVQVFGLPRLVVGDVVGMRRPDAVVTPSSATTTASRPQRVAASVVRRSVDRNLVDELERLARLHRQGSLDDDEYERAKERVLRGGP